MLSLLIASSAWARVAYHTNALPCHRARHGTRTWQWGLSDVCRSVQIGLLPKSLAHVWIIHRPYCKWQMHLPWTLVWLYRVQPPGQSLRVRI